MNIFIYTEYNFTVLANIFICARYYYRFEWNL